MPSWFSAGQVRSVPRSTRQVASVRGGAAAWAPARRRPLVQVPLIPELRAERLLLVHVDVVEALAGLVALVLDERIVRSTQVGEAAAARRLHALGLRLGNPRRGQPEQAAGTRPGVAADEHRRAGLLAVEGQQGHTLLLEPLEARPHVGDVPAKVPEGRRRFGGRRRGDPGEKDQHVGRRLQRRLTRRTCPSRWWGTAGCRSRSPRRDSPS